MSTAGWRVPINVKLLAVLAVPVIGYLFIASTAVVRAQQAANRIRDQASIVKSAVGPTSLTTSLIDERTTTALEAAGLDDQITLRIGKSPEARSATDNDLAALQTMVTENPEARDTYQPAIDDLEAELQGIRADVDAGTADDAAVFTRYSDLIEGVIDANADAVEQVDNAEFWQGAKLAELATRQKDARAVLVNTLIPVSAGADHTASVEQSVQIVRALGAYENRDGAIHELATGRYARSGSILIEATDAADLAELARKTLETEQIDPAELYDLATYKGGFVYDLPTGDYIHDYFRASVVETLGGNADDRVAEANDRVRTHITAGSIGLVITALLTWLVSRSIMRPLRSLTRQVIDTARRRLPNTVDEILATPLGQDVEWPHLAPITITTSDEIGDVADAFNTMQQSALDLAVEEAMLRRQITDSLVTLGQRNQSLLSRQITFITDLERSEADPDILADLFYLDHLAVRMRRNAELLLVLAGVDPPRKWVGPTPVADIVRAALGEASEYKRVRVHDVEGATVVGSATAELSHLLAELIENALIFSPPAETVEVTGRFVPSDEGNSPGYRLAVEDFGVGMTPEDLNQANRRLAAHETTNIAPSTYMGHYIAGKLAARHGISVRLHAKPSGEGLTATVDIPARLLTAEIPADTVSQLPPMPHVVTSAGAVPAGPVQPPLPPIPASPVHPPPTIPLPPILPLAPLVPLSAGSASPPPADDDPGAHLPSTEEISFEEASGGEQPLREMPAQDFDSSELSLPDLSLEALAPDTVSGGPSALTQEIHPADVATEEEDILDLSVPVPPEPAASPTDAAELPTEELVEPVPAPPPPPPPAPVPPAPPPPDSGLLSLDLPPESQLVAVDLPAFAPDEAFAPPAPPEIPVERPVERQEYVVPNLPAPEPPAPPAPAPEPEPEYPAYDEYEDYEEIAHFDESRPEPAPPPKKAKARRKRPIAASRLPVPPNTKRGHRKGR